MAEDAWTKTFDATATNPNAWLASARTLWEAGGLVVKHTPHSQWITVADERVEVIVSERIVGAMLRGMALECALKARSIHLNLDRHRFARGGRFNMPESWGKDGHDLCRIAGSSGVTLNANETALLTRLTALIRFAAKYPIAKTARDMKQIPMPDGRLADPRFFSERELKMVTNFWWRLTDAYPDEAPPRGRG